MSKVAITLSNGFQSFSGLIFLVSPSRMCTFRKDILPYIRTELRVSAFHHLIRFQNNPLVRAMAPIYSKDMAYLPY